MKNNFNRVILCFYTSELSLFFLILLYSIICYGYAYLHGINDKIDLFLYSLTAFKSLKILAYSSMLFFCFKIIYWKLKIKPKPLFHQWWPMLINDIRTTLHKDRIFKAIPLFIALVIFLSLFTNMKGLISYFSPYSWDPFFAKLDRELHFGVDPWRLLQPIFGYPKITFALNAIYKTWFLFLIFFLYWQLIQKSDNRYRLQFYYAFFFTWGINGTLLAIVFASGGPCFYELMTGNDYFSELLHYLNKVNDEYPIETIPAQKMLLDSYQHDKIMIGAGISAMPSIHVATAFLFYMFTKHINKWIGLFFGIYFLLIFFASVHLAWHYAIDGYFSTITTWLYWKFSGILIDSLGHKKGFYS